MTYLVVEIIVLQGECFSRIGYLSCTAGLLRLAYGLLTVLESNLQFVLIVFVGTTRIMSSARFPRTAEAHLKYESAKGSLGRWIQVGFLQTGTCLQEVASRSGCCEGHLQE